MHSAEKQSGRGPVIVWSAGEPSGDRHAAEIVRAIRELRPDVSSVGLGGPAMAAAGVEIAAPMDEVSVFGITAVIGRLPRVLRVFRRMRRLLADRPALFVPVDFPGMNLRLADYAHRQNVPVAYFISPQVWAWGAGRLPRIRRIVRRMLVVFPFEVPIYEQAGVPVTLVGHPLIEQVREVPDREASREALGVGPSERMLVLMPGSRKSELQYLLGPLMAGTAQLRSQLPDLQVFVRLAPGIEPTPVLTAARRQGLDVRLVEKGDPRVVRAADLAIVASGTATLETALLGTPMIIVYRVSPLTWSIARRLVHLDTIGLVNVVAGERIVPELLQYDVTADKVAAAAAPLLTDGSARAAQREAMGRVAGLLGEPGAAERTARAILAELDDPANVAGTAGGGTERSG